MIKNFVVIESVYGKFIVNRHCEQQAETLIKTGRPHIDREIRDILAIIDTLPDGCLLLDAGANIGLIAVPAASAVRAKHGILCAFEPQRMLFNALCGTVALNDLENLIVRHQALGSSVGSIKVAALDYGIPQDFGMLSLVDPSAFAVHEDVLLTTIDTLALPRLDFVKIDVEGMELDVLAGGRATIAKHLPWCWIEYWKAGEENIKKAFEGLPYEFHRMDGLNLLCAPTARLAQSGLQLQAAKAPAEK